MSFTVKFDTGQEVDFEKMPTPADVEEVVGKLNSKIPAATEISAKQDFSVGRPLTPSETTQVAGALPPTLSQVKKMLPFTKEQLPELALSAAGAFAEKTWPGIALSAGGAVAGEAVRQAVFEDRPLTPQERAKRLFFAGLRGATGELGGRVIGKFFKPLSGGVTPEIAQQRATAEAAGIVPPLSTIGGKTAQALERFVEVGPLGAKITAGKDLALKQFGEIAQNVGKDISGDKPAELVGKLAEENVRTFEQTFRQAKDKLYDVVMPTLENVEPSLDNTRNVLQDIIGRRTSLGQSGEVSVLSEYLQKILGKKIPSKLVTAQNESIMTRLSSSLKTFNDLRKFRTNITEEILPLNVTGRTGMAREYQILRDAITRDLDATASKVSPEIATGLKDADRFFAQGINKLKNKLVDSIQNVAAKEPSKLHRLIIRKDSPELLAAGREIVGEEAFNDIKRQWFEDVIKKSTIDAEGLTVVSPAKILSNIRKYGSTVESMFADNPKQLESLNKLTDIAQLLSRGKAITSGSQTAYLQSIAGMFNILQLPQTIANVGIAGLVRTRPGREFLTRGFPKVAKTFERTVQPAIQIGLQKYGEK